MADAPNQPEKRIPKPITIKAADKKADTARIDLNAAKPPPSVLDKANLPADADEFFKRSTMRIDAPPAGDKKSETSRIDLPKRQTAKVDPVSLPPDEAFKTKTAPVGIPVNPATARMKPKTLIMKRPGATAAPGESIIVSAESTAKATEQARKSETARIDLTAEDLDKPATRPKTIRIKRPDGTTGRKALAISRPEESEAPTMGVMPASHEDFADEDDDPGLFAALMGIAALLVAGALFYVLLAQTFAPDLPFPGRI